MEKPLLNAGETSRWIDCSTSTLKKYETEGLLLPTTVTGKNKRLFSASQVQRFIVDCCGGTESSLSEEQGQPFLSSGEVRRRLSVSFEVLASLDRQGLLSPRRRLPLNHKRLYLESDLEKFLSSM